MNYDYVANTIDIYFGNMIDFKKNSLGVYIKATKVDTDNLSKCEISLFSGKYKENIKIDDFLIYKNNEYLLNIKFDEKEIAQVSKDKKNVLKNIKEIETIFYGEIKINNSEKKLILIFIYIYITIFSIRRANNYWVKRIVEND